ncbi:hypothetical protein Tco_0768426 [Tanacetum coccineum]
MEAATLSHDVAPVGSLAEVLVAAVVTYLVKFINRKLSFGSSTLEENLSCAGWKLEELILLHIDEGFLVK